MKPRQSVDQTCLNGRSRASWRRDAARARRIGLRHITSGSSKAPGSRAIQRKAPLHYFTVKAAVRAYAKFDIGRFRKSEEIARWIEQSLRSGKFCGCRPSCSTHPRTRSSETPPAPRCAPLCATSDGKRWSTSARVHVVACSLRVGFHFHWVQGRSWHVAGEGPRRALCFPPSDLAGRPPT